MSNPNDDEGRRFSVREDRIEGEETLDAEVAFKAVRITPRAMKKRWAGPAQHLWSSHQPQPLFGKRRVSAAPRERPAAASGRAGPGQDGLGQAGPVAHWYMLPIRPPHIRTSNHCNANMSTVDATS